MIKIINGTFGYNDGKRVIPKTPKDKPFECDAKTEKRLVSLGVAIYVNKVETDDEEEPIFRTRLLETLPSVNFSGKSQYKTILSK